MTILITYDVERRYEDGDGAVRWEYLRGPQSRVAAEAYLDRFVARRSSAGQTFRICEVTMDDKGTNGTGFVEVDRKVLTALKVAP